MEEIKYRFFALGRVGPEREVFPRNGNTLAISWEKEEERAYFTENLTGKMLFTGDDFHWLYEFENSSYKCEPINLRIEKSCSEGFFSEPKNVRLILNAGDWDLDQCTVEIEAQNEDRYTCYNDNSDKEFNLFDICPAAQTVQLLQGTLEYYDCSGVLTMDPPFCMVDVSGWILLKYEVEQPDEDPPTFEAKYVREKITSLTPLTAPWISIGGNDYVRAPALYNYQYFSTDENNYSFSYQVGGSIDHGMNLKDVFENLFLNICPDMTIKSDFFQWNPDNVSDINYVTGSTSKVKNLKLFQKSDVKRPSADNNATIATITPAKILKDTCVFFNLKWDIDEDGRLVIEHVKFFNKGVGLNLIGRRDAAFRAGTRKYTYDVDNMPKRELFQMMDDQYQYGDFKGSPIVYENSCAGQGDKDDRDWIVENFMTNVVYCLENSGSDSQIVSDDGFVLIACDADNNILSEAPILGYGSYLNNTLSWSRVQEDYWRYGRVFNKFIMNGVERTALSIVPTKKQVKIDVSICCGEDFDPEENVVTDLGEGVISEASFDLYKEMVSMTLLYGSDEDLIENEPPVAVDDDVTTWIGLTVDIDVLANDTDDGTINPDSLEIVFGGSNGTSSIVANKIRYTPNPGYTGTDLIIYRVKDLEWNEVSNNANVNILVKPGSPLPIAGDDMFTIVKNGNLTVGNLLSNDTGDGALTAVPETKATLNGGTVQIFANGSFTYTPALNYVGADSFDYTLKDANNNTDTGTVNITVFEPETVYVSFSTFGESEEPFSFGCEGDPMPHTGTRTLTTQDFLFFSDPLGIIPLDVTGYNLNLLLKLTVSITGGGSDVTFPEYLIPGGVEFEKEVATEEFYIGCDGLSHNTITYDYELLSSPDYVIL